MLSFRERRLAETQLPRISALGNPVNKGNGGTLVLFMSFNRSLTSSVFLVINRSKSNPLGESMRKECRCLRRRRTSSSAL